MVFERREVSMSPKSYWISEKESVSWTFFFLNEYRERRESTGKKNIERKRKERRKDRRKIE